MMMEEMNFLALNLMHEIVTGRRTTDEARKGYAETAMAFMMDRRVPYTEGLQFEVPRGGTADLDETMMAGPMIDQNGGKGEGRSRVSGEEAHRQQL